MPEIFDKDIIKFSFEGEEGITKQLLERYGIVFEKNEIIIREGEKSDDVYYLVKGKCYVVRRVGNKYKAFNIIKQGEIFGEMSAFEAGERSATIIAGENNTICLKFTKEKFDEIFKLHPRWIDKIMEIMSKRIIEMINKLNK